MDTWRQVLIDELRTIASRDDLERRWSGADPKAISSYDEEVDNVFSFGDIDGFLSLNSEQTGLTPPQLLALRQFRDEFSNYVDYTNREYQGMPNFRVVLADPRWAHVMSLAQSFVRLVDEENR